MARKRREDEGRRKSRKQILRERKEARERQMLLATLGPVLVFVIGLLVWGGFTEWRSGRAPVAEVEGTVIRADDFAKRVQWQRQQLLNQLSSFSQMAQTNDPSMLQQLFGGQRENIGQQTIDRMIDEQIIRHEAAERGITVTDAEVQEQLREQLAGLIEQGAGGGAIATEPPTETAEAADEETDGDAEAADEDADAEGTPADGTPDTDRFTEAQYDRAFESFIQRTQLEPTGLTRADYLELLRNDLLREQLTEAIGEEEVPTSGEQVEIQHLLFRSAATAEQAANALQAGASWDEVIADYGPRDAAETESEEAADETAAEATPTADDAADDEAASEDTAPADADPAAAEADTETDELTATEGVTETAALTETAAVTETQPATASETLTETGAITATDGVTTTEGITATDTTTGTTTAATPSPTPEPYAFELSEPEWMSRQALKDRIGLGDDQANAVMDLAPGETSEAYQGTRGNYVLRVVDQADERELPESEIEQRRTEAFRAWLEEQRINAEIDRFDYVPYVPEEPSWFTDNYNQIMGIQQTQPTLDISTLGTPGSGGQAPAP